MSKDTTPKPLEVVPIQPPPAEHRVQRGAAPAVEGEKRNRYSLPTRLESSSPVGYRTRVSLTQDEAQQALSLLSLARPTRFAPGRPASEQVLFEEASLGVLSARQSTNFRGHRATVVGPDDSRKVAALLRKLTGREHDSLDHSTHTHLVLCRPYRTPFTLLLTFVGHRKLLSFPQTLMRAARKRVLFADDIPTIGYLTDLHVGILADSMERAIVIASDGQMRANVLSNPFVGETRKANKKIIRQLEHLAGITPGERATGWRLGLVTQVGHAIPDERVDLPREVARKVGANLLSFRSERIQPGVNQEEKAPAPYQTRQPMDVPDELTVQAARAGYNAFVNWTNVDREHAKALLLFDRIDVLTDGGKERLRAIRTELSTIADKVVDTIPKWADLPVQKAFSRNAKRGKKAFALAGQRIYITGLDEKAVRAASVDYKQAIRAVGAANARSALYAELMGVTDLPADCDLLAGICLMAGPVNQNDIGKSFFGYKDLLTVKHPGDPTSMLVWTLKAKTVADPIGNEEQLLNEKRKGALVDLRPGPHEVITLKRRKKLVPMRSSGGSVNRERAFGDVDNFVRAPDGSSIDGNEGQAWRGDERVW